LEIVASDGAIAGEGPSLRSRVRQDQPVANSDDHVPNWEGRQPESAAVAALLRIRTRAAASAASFCTGKLRESATDRTAYS
jgi:hypothetical protein